MKAAIYARYSSDNQREESIEAQIKYISDFAKHNNYEIVKVYTDEARSATTDRRPQFQEMMRDASSELFDVVIVHKLDRFSRDRYDFAYYKRHLKKYGIRLISVLENLDDSPESVILESVLEGLAEYYSKNLAREVMRKGMIPNAEKCKHNGGIPPLGYNVGPDQHYIVNDEEARAVRIIFERFADGSGYSAIIDELNRLGFKTKTGKPFGKNSLHEILKNEKYKGVYTYNKTQQKLAGRRNGHKLKDDSEIIRIPGGVPVIVDEALWNRVAAKMQKNKRQQASYKAHRTYVLSGVLVCGHCNSSFVGNTARQGRNKAIYSYYECGNKKRTKTCNMKAIGASYIENEVISSLYDYAFAPVAIEKFATEIVNSFQGQRSEIPGYLKDAKKQLSKTEKEIGRIISAISDGMYHESMKEKMDELEASRAALQTRISEAEYELDAYNFSYKEVLHFLEQFQNVKDADAEF